MNRLQQVVVTVPNEQTLRAWEDMRIEALHEIQDGAIADDESMEALANLAVVLGSWAPERRAPAQPKRA